MENVTIKYIDFSESEINATIHNIKLILDENGIKKNSKNEICLAIILISESIANGLDESQIMFNFKEIYEMIIKNFSVSRR